MQPNRCNLPSARMIVLPDDVTQRKGRSKSLKTSWHCEWPALAWGLWQVRSEVRRVLNVVHGYVDGFHLPAVGDVHGKFHWSLEPMIHHISIAQCKTAVSPMEILQSCTKPSIRLLLQSIFWPVNHSVNIAYWRPCIPLTVLTLLPSSQDCEAVYWISHNGPSMSKLLKSYLGVVHTNTIAVDLTDVATAPVVATKNYCDEILYNFMHNSIRFDLCVKHPQWNGLRVTIHITSTQSTDRSAKHGVGPAQIRFVDFSVYFSDIAYIYLLNHLNYIYI